MNYHEEIQAGLTQAIPQNYNRNGDKKLTSWYGKTSCCQDISLLMAYYLTDVWEQNANLTASLYHQTFVSLRCLRTTLGISMVTLIFENIAPVGFCSLQHELQIDAIPKHPWHDLWCSIIMAIQRHKLLLVRQGMSFQEFFEERKWCMVSSTCPAKLCPCRTFTKGQWGAKKSWLLIKWNQGDWARSRKLDLLLTVEMKELLRSMGLAVTAMKSDAMGHVDLSASCCWSWFNVREYISDM